MTILVTGAAGGLGAALLPRLHERGWRVRALQHRRPVLGADESRAGDLTDERSLLAAADGAEAIVHLAALTHARTRRAYEEINLRGTERLLRAAQAAGVQRLVYVSTRAVSRDGGGYAESKLAAEEAVAASGLLYVTVRLPEVIGGQSAEGVDKIVALARKGSPIPVAGDGSYEVCPIGLDDAVGAIAAALEAPPRRTYTLAGEPTTMRAFADACIAAAGSSSRVVRVPVPLLAAAGVAARVLPLPLYPDQLARLRATKPAPSPEAARELNFSPRPLHELLAEAFATP